MYIFMCMYVKIKFVENNNVCLCMLQMLSYIDKIHV